VAGLRALLVFAVLTTGLGACALIEGLSEYSKEDCSQGCGDDGSSDGAEPPRDDGSTTPDVSMTTDTGTRPDVSDAGSVDVADASDGGSAVPESGADAGGCGPLTSVDNCGSCGVQCSATTGTPSCTGTTCAYVCTAGRSDCNTAAPDTDGCECATPGCCGSACQTDHSDGVGQSYFDCNQPATYTEMTAFSACAAYALSVGSSATNCVGGLTCRGSSVPTVCFTSSSGSCATYCWQYTGVYADSGPGTVWDCACPAHRVGGWN
jgi:hypothetical protein